jgi:hypothetical protein
MKHSWAGLIELFVVLLFVAGWGVLELVTLRMDRRRSARQAAEPRAGAASQDAPRHPEG